MSARQRVVVQTHGMHHAEAEWDVASHRSRQTVVGSEEALRLCEQIEQIGVEHLLVSFTSQQGTFFAVGLGAADSCAVFWESADPPYFQSRGDMSSEGPPVTYWYGGQPSQMPASVRIPRSDALDALAEFMSTGRRPECVEWDET